MKDRRELREEKGNWLSRRQLLRIGGLGAFGLNLARLFQAEATGHAILTGGRGIPYNRRQAAGAAALKRKTPVRL